MKPGEQVRGGGLPCPGRPYQGNDLPAGQPERHFAQHQVAVTVPERHPIIDHVLLEARGLLPRPVDLGRRLVEELEHPLGARQGDRHGRGERRDGLEW